MSGKSVLQLWVVEALRELGGAGSVVDVCAIVWRRHEQELRQSGDLFYTWQYDIRWAAQVLRDTGVLKRASGDRRRPWALDETAP